MAGFIEGPSVASGFDEILFSSVCLWLVVLSTFFVVLLVLFVISAVLVEAVMCWDVCAFSIVLLTVAAAWVVGPMLVVCAWFVELLNVLVAWVVSVGLTVGLVPDGVFTTVVVFIVVCAEGVSTFVVRNIVVVLTVVGDSKQINKLLCQSSKANHLFCCETSV